MRRITSTAEAAGPSLPSAVGRAPPSGPSQRPAASSSRVHRPGARSPPFTAGPANTGDQHRLHGTVRAAQTATLLPDGQVLIAARTNFVSHRATFLASTELYTP